MDKKHTVIESASDAITQSNMPAVRVLADDGGELGISGRGHEVGGTDPTIPALPATFDAATMAKAVAQKFVGISPSTPTFGPSDWKELARLAAKLAPEGSERDLRRAKTRMVDAADDAGRTLAAKEYLDKYGMVEQPDYDAVLGIVNKAFEAKAATIDQERYDAIYTAQDYGIINDANERVRKEQAAAAAAAYRAASDLRRHVFDVLGSVQGVRAATLTDEEKDAAVARWKEESEFAKARSEFQETLAATKDMRAKAALRMKYPEFE
ncbi:MAG: hypothetical protein IJI35_14635 [Kiritimatiellae bacterium]|nr:hypothetical protein [Kiritimatiellia bacterium]